MNGDRSIGIFASKPNGGRNANGIIIEYIRDLFTVNNNFIIFSQNYIVPIPVWFIRYEKWHSFPEFTIVTGAVFLKQVARDFFLSATHLLCIRRFSFQYRLSYFSNL